MQISTVSVPPFTQLNCSVIPRSLKSMKLNSTHSLASTVTRFEHHWTTLSVSETRLRNRFPPSTLLKKLEDVLHQNCLKIRRRLFKTCTSPFQEGLQQYWRQQLVQHHTNKEIYTVSVVFPLYCRTLVSPTSKTNTVSSLDGITRWLSFDGPCIHFQRELI
jgi:hypothetical protein